MMPQKQELIKKLNETKTAFEKLPGNASLAQRMGVIIDAYTRNDNETADAESCLLGREFGVAAHAYKAVAQALALETGNASLLDEDQAQELSNQYMRQFLVHNLQVKTLTA